MYVYILHLTLKSQSRLATFQVLSRHMWLVAAVQDSPILEASNFYNLMPVIYRFRI